MKKILIILCLALLGSCQDDDLPKANFDLHAVTLLTGTPGHEKVDLLWNAPANGTPISYRIKSITAEIQLDISADTTFYEVKGLTNGENHDFTVQAVYGENQISGVAELDLTPIDQLNFIALPGNQQIIASWNSPSRTDISGYTIAWEEQSVAVDETTNSYQIFGLTNDTEYEIELVINYDDGSTSSPVVSSATPSGVVKPFFLSEESPQSNTQVQFNYNLAFSPNTTIVSWLWDFGDGNTSDEQDPIHTYSDTGIYTVTLNITDDQGNPSVFSEDVSVWGIKWTYDVGAQIKPQIPTIADDGTIYIGSDDNTNFHAINPDGTLKWTYTQIGDNVYSSASIGSDGTIYVGSKQLAMHAINPDGSQKWVFAMASDVIYSSPAIANDGTIYIGSDDANLYAVNPDGSQKWVFPTSAIVRSTPAIGPNGTVYFASDDQNLYALNPSNGNMLWSFPTSGDVEGGISIDVDGTIIVSVADEVNNIGFVHALNPDGSLKWTSTLSGRALSSPTVANNTVYVGTKDSNQLIAINATSGSQLWSFDEAEGIILSSPTIDVNGNIYFGSFDDNVYVLNPDGTVKYSYTTGGNVWSSAVIGADGTVYIGGYDGKLYAFEFFAEGLADDTWPMFGKNLKHTANAQ